MTCAGIEPVFSLRARLPRWKLLCYPDAMLLFASNYDGFLTVIASLLALVVLGVLAGLIAVARGGFPGGSDDPGP